MKHTWSELIEKAKLDDQNAFSELYQNSYDAVYRTVRSMVKDGDAALDIVQDAYIKGFNSLSSLEEPDNFVPWMKRIATNKAKDWFKKRHDISFSQLSDDEGNEPDFEDDRTENLPEEVIDRGETARLIEEILGTLSDEQRIAVGMFYYQNMSVAEIAETLGVSENTVKSRLSYGRKKIKDGVLELEKRGTKLYGLAPIPFLLLLFRNQTAQLTAGNAPTALFSNIAAATAEPGTVAASASAGTAPTVAAGKAGGLLSSLGAKITAGVLATAIVGSGIGTAAYFATRGDDSGDIPVIADTYTAPADETQTTTAPSESGEPETSYTVESDEPGEEVIMVSEGLSFALTDGRDSYAVTRIGSCKDTDIVIPSSYNGLPVTEIREQAFNNSQSITSVIIPDGVTSIGEQAFFNCKVLTDITIPDSVTSIGNNAFAYCESLNDIIIPSGLTSISAFTFYGCASLKDVIIPNSVTSIGERAFDGCTSLTDVTIPDSVTIIEYEAFIGCTGLTSVTIPDSVTSIGEAAFYGCTGLTDITVPGSVASIDRMFGGCTSLTNVIISDGVTRIGVSAFWECRGLTSLTIPDSVTSIGSGAFSHCTGITNIAIPNGVTSIENLAFEECTSLTNITISDGVTSIGNAAFKSCIGLTNITIPDSVTGIGIYAFNGCTSLTDITYHGTKAQWESFDVCGDYLARSEFPSCIVHCTDGDISY